MTYLAFEAEDGRRLSYQRRGSGPPVVCIPGGPGMDPEAYFAELELPGHQLLLFAPRGTGESSAPSTRGGYGIAGYVDDVEVLRVHLGQQKLTLYGNSHGACVALAYAGAHPGRVERLVLMNGPARMDDAFIAAAGRARTHFAETLADGADRLAGRRGCRQRARRRARRGGAAAPVPHADGWLCRRVRASRGRLPRPPLRRPDELGAMY